MSIRHLSLGKFIISRLTRLYPVYWICVSTTFLVTLIYGAPKYFASFKQFIFNLTMFQNYFGVDSIDGVYWTLFVEMKFYIFIVVTFLILNKIKSFKINHLAIVWLILSILNIPFGELFIFKVLNYFMILNWSSYFIAGILFFQIYNKGLSFYSGSVIFISYLLSIHHAFIKMEYLELKYNSDFSFVIISLIILMFYALMFLVSLQKLNIINSKKLLYLGILTYPLYLIHQNIGYIIINKLSFSVDKYILLSLVVCFMVLFSFVLSKYIEPPFSNYLKNKLVVFSIRLQSFTKNNFLSSK